MALSLGTVASLRPAAQQLQAKRPPQQLLCLKNCVLVFETVVVAAVSEAAVLAMLTSQPWFTGGTGQSHEVRLVPQERWFDRLPVSPCVPWQWM